MFALPHFLRPFNVWAVIRIRYSMWRIRMIALLMLVAILVLSCSTGDGVETPVDVETPIKSGENILLIIADDMGKDATVGFSEGSIKPDTPHLNNIRTSGLTFTNLWVNPSCAPTRASLITGKYGFRTGVTWSGRSLPGSENILQNYIAEETNNRFATAVIGKWHLTSSRTFNPESLGIDYYAGLLPHLNFADSYYSWQLTEDGSSTTNSGYVTEVLTDLAIDWVRSQEASWFLWLAYNAPHGPFHVPPSTMHSQGDLPEYRLGMNALPYYMAAIEAMDFQIGRLLASMTPQERENTTIIFIGDNGPPRRVVQSPYAADRAKGTLYQGGINTPMFVSGNRVMRTGTDNSLINGTDLYATIAHLAGVEVTEIYDSKSFLSLLTAEGSHRETQYSEMDDGTDDLWTIRNERYKLIVNANGHEEMYDLLSDAYEANDLLSGLLDSEQSLAKVALEAHLDSIRHR